MIMMRTLRADLRRYNSQDLSDDEGETGSSNNIFSPQFSSYKTI